MSNLWNWILKIRIGGNMRAEDCPRLNTCPTVKSLRDHEWMDDSQLAASIREVCETCPYQPKVSSVLVPTWLQNYEKECQSA